jgi:hypothetical protein
MYGYESCLRCGWKTGIHDCRGMRYEHPYVVIHRPSGSAVGCWSREEARRVLAALKAGRSADSTR